MLCIQLMWNSHMLYIISMHSHLFFYRLVSSLNLSIVTSFAPRQGAFHAGATFGLTIHLRILITASSTPSFSAPLDEPSILRLIDRSAVPREQDEVLVVESPC